MADKKVNRVINVRTAVGLSNFGRESGGPGTLEAVLRAIHAVHKTKDDRRAPYQSRIVECYAAPDVPGGLALYLAGHVPDDPVAVLQHAAGTMALVPPPERSDFLDGELMVLVAGNIVLTFTSGLTEKALTAYVYGLAEASGLKVDDVKFGLERRADVDRLELIRKEGVKSIALKAAASRPAVEEIEKAGRSVRQRVVGSVVEEIKAILKAEGDVPEDVDNLLVEVFLRFNRHNAGDLQQEQLQEIAEMVTNEDEEEGFEIITRTGKRLRFQDVALNKRVRLRTYGKSVAFDEVLAEMRTYLNELNAPGQPDEHA